MLIGYDTTTLATIPHHPQVVLAYDDGTYSDYKLAKRLFPHAHVFSICVRAEDDGDFLDVENFDARPEQAGPWVRRRIDAGAWNPGIYGSLSAWKAIDESLAANRIERDEVRKWKADWTHVPHMAPDANLTQWTDRALGRNLDESLIFPDAIPPRAHEPARWDSAEIQFDARTGQWRVHPLGLDARPLG